MMLSPSQPARRVVAAATCAALLTLYAAAAWCAARRDSPTYDEPCHALAGWLERHERDYRLDPQNPPLWKRWASLANGARAVSPDLGSPDWVAIPGDVSRQLPWSGQTLFQTPGNDGLALIERAQAMMLVWAVALGAIVAAWSWRLGGPVAAVVSTGLFALDPNFLAHGPLMKNDVACAVAVALLAGSLSCVGRRVTWGTAAAVSAAVALGLTVKFTGLLAGAIVPAVLGLRALSPQPWVVFGRSVTTRRWRAAVALTLCLTAAAAGGAGVWAAYGFRYGPTPDPAVRFDLSPLVELCRAVANVGHPAGDGAPPLSVRVALTADRYRLVPQAYTAGFLYTYAFGMPRPAFLMGAVSNAGWWYYLPIAAAVKTPIATLLAGLAAAGVARAAGHRRAPDPGHAWSRRVLLVTAGVYLASAMSSNLATGVRHLLPVYALAFVAVGWAAAAAHRRWRRPTGVVLIALGAMLVAESAAAWPGDLAFFNLVGRAAGGGIRLLSDSNLDWGQGLPQLARWQRDHPAEPLYLCYFGTVDPAAYGIRYRPLPGGFHRDGDLARLPDPLRPCVVAYSVTHLQGTYAGWTDIGRTNLPWLHRTPTAVLGGSIYLYAYVPPSRGQRR